ncbi:DUF192 domain-containing protein [Butyricimonas virosa]|jgi:uncharacterized membrane protein (UPF0127 family)|uniref:DUF192 domain-containing protein n=1 Tax=Butyricimonas virosa TaxID=544645 RepID=A0ABX7H6Z1_9BACT|nr:DUF192 domain-containing protein [Butyricimonas virosa]QRO50685.1 DUF192 domain-containing protein [Butyricimonas virosa]UWO48603.1 DUF192 domain-containing protein [Butyricimonas virosa]DAL02912.1 MAG TPA: hypothetical protein [Crassvirales sp.]
MPELSKKNFIEIEVGDNDYICRVAYDDWEKANGLMGVDDLGDNEGMIFVYDQPQEEISFWMKDTPIDLDIVFICPCFKVISVHTGIANTTDPIVENNVQFVLEVKANSGIKEGDEVEFDGLEEYLEKRLDRCDSIIENKEDIEEEKDKIKTLLKVLDPDGEVQLTLKGNERIFSRANTKVLIRQAKKADKLKTDSAYKRLGKSIFKYMRIQDENGEEYVEPKK